METQYKPDPYEVFLDIVTRQFNLALAKRPGRETEFFAIFSKLLSYPRYTILHITEFDDKILPVFETESKLVGERAADILMDTIMGCTISIESNPDVTLEGIKAYITTSVKLMKDSAYFSEDIVDRLDDDRVNDIFSVVLWGLHDVLGDMVGVISSANEGEANAASAAAEDSNKS